MGAISYRDEYRKIAFTPPQLRGAWTRRVEIFVEKYVPLLSGLGFEVVEPEVYSEEILYLVHDREYVDYVKRMSKSGRGWLDYGDTPAYPGVFEDALLAVSGTVHCAEQLDNRSVCFNPQGGFHHARRRSAGGFCVFNDVALAARILSKRGRTAVVDVDAHHGDGTQDILYRDSILKISVHGYGYGFYPGTGWIDELGEGEGKCLNVNVPVPLASGDDVFEKVLEELLAPLLDSYGPRYIVLQGGVDGHRGDPLVGLRFTDNSYWRLALLLHSYVEKGAKVVVTGGGGYVPVEAARLWALELAAILGGDMSPIKPVEEESVSDEYTKSIVDDRVSFLKEKLSACNII